MKSKFNQDNKHTMYFNRYNEEVPSATTILKMLNKPQLVKWANHLGFNHLSVDEVLNESSTLGSLVHSLINSILEKELIIYIPQENIRSSVIYSYINRFRIWYDTNDVIPILLEKSISSEKFGGTIDFYGQINGKYTLLDFKTSKKIRLTMFIQLALYVILLEELGYKIDQVGILLVNPKFKDEKYIAREKFDKYVKFARGLVDLFWSYYFINEDDKWYEIII